LTEEKLSKYGYFCVCDFHVDVGDNRVFYGDQSKHIEPKAMQVLYHLALNAGETVSRQELMENVWEGRVVIEDALTRTISHLRACFDDSKDRKLFQTVPKKGYRLTQDVTWLSRAEFIARSKPNDIKVVEEPKSISFSQKRLLFVAAALLLFVIGYLAYTSYQSATSSQTSALEPIQQNRITVAFLPFRNLSGDTNNAYLAEMLPEELSIRLSKTDQIDVLAHYSSIALANKQNNIGQAYIDKLNAAYIVEGSITEANDTIRVLIRLVDTQTSSAKWSEVYSNSMEQLLTVQQNIVDGLSKQILPTATINRREDPSTSINVDAYQAYLQGNYWLMNGKTSEWFYKAEASFIRATELDPSFSEAFGNLAFIYARSDYHDIYLPPNKAKQKAYNAIQRALSLSPNVLNALLAEALIATKELRFTNAKASLQKVLKLDPKNTRALYVFSELALAMNQFDVALSYATEALMHDPLSPWINVNKAIVHYWRYELEESLKSVNDAIAIDPNYTWAYVWKAKILLEQDKIQQALSVMEKSHQIDNGSAVNAIYLGLLYDQADDTEQADKWLSHAASLYGDTADARFWQNYLAIKANNVDNKIALQLIDELQLEHSRFFNLYNLHYGISKGNTEHQEAWLAKLLKTVEMNDGFWVNHQNQHAAYMALDLIKQLDLNKYTTIHKKLYKQIKAFEQTVDQALLAE